jgi:DNA-binding beta-propeller fold protein YncE
VWVTAPQAHALEVLDAAEPSSLKQKTSIEVAGSPEGFAVDEARGRFFTNLEDRGDTVVIDVADQRPVATWNAGCGADGPRGLAYAADRGYLIVACTDHVQVLDAAHDGARLGRLETGAGVDNIDYGGGIVYVAAARAATLTVASVDAHGGLQLVATAETSQGARNAVVDARGRVYVADSPGARLLVFDAPRAHAGGFAP